MTVSTRQWHLAGQEFKTQKTTWTNSSCRQCNRVLTFKASVQKSNWHWNATGTIYRESRCEWCSVTRREMSLKHVAKGLFLSYLPRDMGKMAIFDKNTTSFAVHKASKKGGYLSKSVTGLYLQYRRAQLMDEDCLATPDPTTSTFLSWINTNRMGTAKRIFAMFLY